MKMPVATQKNIGKVAQSPGTNRKKGEKKGKRKVHADEHEKSSILINRVLASKKGKD